MWPDPPSDGEPSTFRPASPRFRLRLSPIVGRVFLVVFLLLEVAVWLSVVRPNWPFRPRYRRILAMLYFTPGLATKAFLAAAVTGVASDLVFRLLIRPLMLRWYNPRPLDEANLLPLPFRLQVGERVEGRMPARLVTGPRRTAPGELVRTDRRLVFFSFDWREEPWELPLMDWEYAEAFTPRRRVLGWVAGYPDHVRVEDDRGDSAVFVVPEPARLMAWWSPEAGGEPGRSPSDEAHGPVPVPSPA